MPESPMIMPKHTQVHSRVKETICEIKIESRWVLLSQSAPNSQTLLITLESFQIALELPKVQSNIVERISQVRLDGNQVRYEFHELFPDLQCFLFVFHC